jgi:hypothetical protein
MHVDSKLYTKCPRPRPPPDYINIFDYYYYDMFDSLWTFIILSHLSSIRQWLLVFFDFFWNGTLLGFH